MLLQRAYMYNGIVCLFLLLLLSLLIQSTGFLSLPLIYFSYRVLAILLYIVSVLHSSRTLK